jgi:hypothetical protein
MKSLIAFYISHFQPFFAQWDTKNRNYKLNRAQKVVFRGSALVKHMRMARQSNFIRKRYFWWEWYRRLLYRSNPHTCNYLQLVLYHNSLEGLFMLILNFLKKSFKGVLRANHWVFLLLFKKFINFATTNKNNYVHVLITVK